MSTTKHTPTPWRIHEEFPDTIIGLDGVEIACCDNYSSVAATENEKTDAANAAFIVRACNSHYLLVAALDKMVLMYVALVESGDAGFWDAARVPEVIVARAALAAAGAPRS